MDANACPALSSCNNQVGGFVCTCDEGYAMNIDVCEDVDECSLGLSNCGPNADCTNTVGSFDCACKDGYSMSGSGRCENINECTAGTSDCGEYQTCKDTIGSFKCVCTKGYHLVSPGDADCTDIDECDLNIDACNVHSTCDNTVTFQNLLQWGQFILYDFGSLKLQKRCTYYAFRISDKKIQKEKNLTLKIKINTDLDFCFSENFRSKNPECIVKVAYSVQIPLILTIFNFFSPHPLYQNFQTLKQMVHMSVCVMMGSSSRAPPISVSISTNVWAPMIVPPMVPVSIPLVAMNALVPKVNL